MIDSRCSGCDSSEESDALGTDSQPIACVLDVAAREAADVCLNRSPNRKL
ncbi:MAG: hypothetical protein JWN14_4886 [Chthonomonadales bacterium]|nr:hypothetical protein [Chthonomonadales bacterium]